RLEQAGRAAPMMAAALSTHIARPQQIVVVGGRGHLWHAVTRRYLPFATVLAPTAAEQRAFAPRLPLIADMQVVSGSETAYLCENFSCRAPMTSAQELERALTLR